MSIFENIKDINEKTSGDEVTSQKVFAVMPIGDMILFPRMMAGVVINEKSSVQLVDDALQAGHMIALCAIKDGTNKVESSEDIYHVGTSVIIIKMNKQDEGLTRIAVQGMNRIKIDRIIEEKPYIKAEVTIFKDSPVEGIEIDALTTSIKNQFKRLLELAPHLPREFEQTAVDIEEPGVLADMVASILNVSKKEKQEIIETFDVKERLDKTNVLLTHQLEILELGNKIQQDVKSGMDKSQKEYFLKEQLKAIQKELGIKDDTLSEINNLRERLEKKGLSKEAMEEAQKELGRISNMSPQSAEYTVSRTYLDWMLDLPWSDATEDNLNVKYARGVLDDDHYDLDKIKKRILEYLAVRQLKKDMKGPILCLIGPPGTGKTSLGRSIARALGRKFIRISLGGVRDEAEIRGHRRTYVGALPGKIIQGLKRSGSNNPVFMLDEIDKLGSDYRGDPSSALLEVLDPEQNNSFVDHYLNVGFDLSKVMFITTANLYETIPAPLLDRMEVIEIPGYTTEDKVHIANKYLIPKQIKEHGLTNKQFKLNKNALVKVINNYTREAGLRNLERTLATLCRGVAREIVEGEIEQAKIYVKNLKKYLGPVRIHHDTAENKIEPGIATGLAWTASGGEILFIEATKMPGHNNLKLTGKLGDVMKESAEAALSYIRSHHDAYGLSPDFLDKQDIHIHVPAGAVPKDGPSAGVTIFTALISLFTDMPVNPNTAMTGEISLRGRVLPIGGIKEKMLAAKRAGIKRILLPKENMSDLEEIPAHFKKDIEIIPVSSIDELPKLALIKSINK